MQFTGTTIFVDHGCLLPCRKTTTIHQTRNLVPIDHHNTTTSTSFRLHALKDQEPPPPASVFLNCRTPQDAGCRRCFLIRFPQTAAEGCHRLLPFLSLHLLLANPLPLSLDSSLFLGMHEPEHNLQSSSFSYSLIHLTAEHPRPSSSIFPRWHNKHRHACRRPPPDDHLH